MATLFFLHQYNKYNVMLCQQLGWESLWMCVLGILRLTAHSLVTLVWGQETNK